jgi:uncharacterized membrane protein
MNEIGGLPAHPLVVHLPVVLVPLAVVAALLMAVRPAWFERLGTPSLLLAALGTAGAFLASGSGEELEDRFRAAGETVSGTLRDHAEMGELVPWLALLFFVALLGWVLAIRKDWAPTRRRAVRSALAALVVVAGLGAAASVYVVGHSGATSVWEQAEG